MGTQLPSPKGTQPPIFGQCPFVQTARWTKMPLGMEVGLGPGHIVLDGNPVAWGTALPPQFLAHLCCGQMAGWIKMPLVTMVGLSPGNIVLDALQTQLHLPGAQLPPPNFGLCLLWPNGWMDQDATRYEGRPWPRPHCITWGPSSPPLPKGAQAPNFPMSVVAKYPSQLLLSSC